MTLETVVLAPGVLLIALLLVAAGRISLTQQAVASAARDAARQASLARSPAQARQWATSSALASLRHEGLQCRPAVSLDLQGFQAPLGEPASVRARVACTVPLSDLAVPGLPGTWSLTASFVSPLAPFRGR